MMKWYELYIIMIIIIIGLLSIIYLFENQNKYKSKELIEIESKVNLSNNEYIVICPNKSYDIFSKDKLIICGNIYIAKIRKNYIVNLTIY